MAMMIAIAGMMEVATQITSQPLRSVPKESIYKASPAARSNDQRFIELISNLSGNYLGTQDVLCKRLMCEIGDSGQCLEDETAGDSFLDLADYSISSSRTSSHPRLVNSCVLTNTKLAHRILISPVSNGSTDYRLYSCILTPKDPGKCLFEES